MGDGKADGLSNIIDSCTGAPILSHPHGRVLTPRAACPGQASSVPFQGRKTTVPLGTSSYWSVFLATSTNDRWYCVVLIPTEELVQGLERFESMEK
eukprot:scaffold212553_cov35-Attheya_sp.AAC.1